MSDPQLSKPRRVEGVLHYQVFEELVIYRSGACQAVSLNETAAAIWELCNGERSVEEICSELAPLAAGDDDRVQNDVSEGITRLYELGLLCEGSA